MKRDHAENLSYKHEHSLRRGLNVHFCVRRPLVTCTPAPQSYLLIWQGTDDGQGSPLHAAQTKCLTRLAAPPIGICNPLYMSIPDKATATDITIIVRFLKGRGPNPARVFCAFVGSVDFPPGCTWYHHPCIKLCNRINML